MMKIALTARQQLAEELSTFIRTRGGWQKQIDTPLARHDFVPYTLDCCPDCGGSLVLSRREPEVLQQVEITETPTIVTGHQGLAYWCPHCRNVQVCEPAA